ncbi:A/G-specific adenine glycosylase [Trypanosoma theileri]|uniref:Adenine DNA glycosylase n=1 Tax=Trypanosoma theileri TaxID=67003 RepID=A0A1X0NR87_9TRYP|nr:A/G-specific adenine glycosylase [Trypanosoma theileri]ORC87058.1 A/G-specific adenine glycosylase [Trypanosoma theileri]
MNNSHREIQKAIIEWFEKHQRQDLPWRQPFLSKVGSTTTVGVPVWVPDPYHVWVSEVMSQQTQMDTVIRYFKRWIDIFPNVATLAEANEESVKAVWSGMGYYRRAMYLKKGAEYVLKQFGGNLPCTASQLMKVPGIGPYTAAAIASICFGEEVISVDGNVVRVLSRLRCERDFDPKVPKNIKTVIQWGQELMNDGPCNNPGALNQGLMEIGARVCKPSGRPLCEQCPVQQFCKAYAAKERGELEVIEGIIPLRALSVKKKKEKVICVVHEFLDKNKDIPSLRHFIVVQRPNDGLLGGMLEFPSITYSSSFENDTKKEVENTNGDSYNNNGDDYNDKKIIKLREKLSAGHSAIIPIGSVRHIFSHIDMEVMIYHALWSESKEEDEKIIRGAKKEETSSFRMEQLVCASLAKELGIVPSRICVKTEEEIIGSAASRLLLKILYKLPLNTNQGNSKVMTVKKRPRTTV